MLFDRLQEPRATAGDSKALSAEESRALSAEEMGIVSDEGIEAF